jgi:hypothetical protein
MTCLTAANQSKIYQESCYTFDDCSLNCFTCSFFNVDEEIKFTKEEKCILSAIVGSYFETEGFEGKRG